MEPDGRSFITSVGTHESSIWIHDSKGDRALSSEGEVVASDMTVSFSPDGNFLYYLLRHGPAKTSLELWRTVIETGNSEAVLPGVSALSFNLSADGRDVVYASPGSDGKPYLWTSPLDRSAPPAPVGNVAGLMPVFGPNRLIYFQVTEGKSNYLEKVHRNGSGLSRVVPYPISGISGISPSRQYIAAVIPVPPFGGGPAPSVIPVDGRESRRLCAGYCVVTWSLSGDYLFLSQLEASRTTPGRSLAIPVGPNGSLAAIPSQGITSTTDPSAVPGSVAVPRDFLVPGPDLAHYAYINDSAQRNLYRITLP